MEFILALIEQALGKYPVIGSVLMVVGALRLVVKPFIMPMVQAVVAYTPSPKDDGIVAKVFESAPFKAFLYALDLFTSIKFPKK